jgi:nucleoside-diphosphate-sugar epimerase
MTKRVFVTGAAGLVGQNLVASLVNAPGVEVVGGDKHLHNLDILRRLNPSAKMLAADFAEAGAWEDELASADVIVMLQAQIGGLHEEEFIRNNIDATRRILDVATRGKASYLVHVSSSVVNSAARDFYTETKKAQESLVLEYPIRKVILRPTLMFGWFDRKHVGWLKRFLDKAPVFPIPGDGRYLRQPLFAGDFSAIIESCLRSEIEGSFNITGLERIDYVDMIKTLRAVTGAKAPIVHIPYGLFRALLAVYARFDKNPPFTTSQLKALATPDVFEVIDWPGIFGVPATPLREAFERTFRDPKYSDVSLEF